jgi:hypothetical protein
MQRYYVGAGAGVSTYNDQTRHRPRRIAVKKWFKFLGVSTVVVLAVAVIAGVALAQGPVNEDGDGVCDSCGEQTGDGLMRGWRFSQNDETEWSGQGWGAAGEVACDEFIDEDGDGVCDLCGATEDTLMRGQGMAQSGEVQRQGRGPSANGEQLCDDFVDEDGDGVCDDHSENLVRTFAGRGGRGRVDGGQMQDGQGRR